MIDSIVVASSFKIQTIIIIGNVVFDNRVIVGQAYQIYPTIIIPSYRVIFDDVPICGIEINATVENRNDRVVLNGIIIARSQYYPTIVSIAYLVALQIVI